MTREERKEAIKKLETILKELCPTKSVNANISVEFINAILLLVDAVVDLENDFNNLASYYYDLFEGDLIHIEDAENLMRKHHLIDKDGEWIVHKE